MNYTELSLRLAMDIAQLQMILAAISKPKIDLPEDQQVFLESNLESIHVWSKEMFEEFILPQWEDDDEKEAF